MKVKCRYKNCKHDNRELDKDDAVLSGKASYYHKDCYKEMTAIKRVIDVYVKKVDNQPIFTQLRQVVNKLIIEQGVDSEYLIFAINYCADLGIIKHPPGLFYIVKNERVKKEWDKRLTAKYMHQEREREAIVNNSTRKFIYNPTKEKTVADILG